MTRNWTLLIVASTLAISACGRKAATLPPPPAQAPVEAPATQPGTGTGTDTVGTTNVPGSAADFRARAGSDTVLFATDSYQLDDQSRETLRRQAEWLGQYSNVRATIEGHADERGTREYNLALGERRANAAKNFLAANGVNPSRLTVISYGKERPAVEGNDESAWQANRRAVTVVLAGQ